MHTYLLYNFLTKGDTGLNISQFFLLTKFLQKHFTYMRIYLIN